MSKFNLTTREGIEQAKQHLVKKRLEGAINEFHAGVEAELDIEALETQLQGVEILNDFQTERPTPKISPWGEIETTEREWLIKNWLPANTVTMFTGEGGAGKSWLTLQAVCQIACGFRNAFLNPNFTKTADIESRRSVVFATYEDEPAEIKRRLFALASGMPWIEDSVTTIQQHVHIVDMRGVGSVWGPGVGKHIANTGDLLASGDSLRNLCEEQEARLLVMDPLSGAFGSSENDRTAVYDFVSSFRGWGDYAKCAMLLIGHLPKSEEGKKAGFSGSTAWEASARSMWMLAKKSFVEGVSDPKARYYWALQHTKVNYAKLQDDKPLIKNPNGWWREAATKEEAADGYEAYHAEWEPRDDANLTPKEVTDDTQDDRTEADAIVDAIANYRP